MRAHLTDVHCVTPLLASCPAKPADKLASGASEAANPAPAWLLDRAAQENRLAAASTVMHDFRFTDKLAASGISFRNEVVDDAGKAYKLVHYDHGSGVCSADVDGDGLPDLYFATQLGTNELWKNVGNDRFVDITSSSGLAIPDAIAVACSFADID